MTSIKQKSESVFSAEAKALVVAGIPAYNEENTIARLVLEAQKYVDVVLVCDDGSNDCTAEIAERMGADVIQHEKNLGYGAATKSLLTMARELDADVLVTFDGDGQHDPNEIPNLIKPLLEDTADVVLGSRFLEPHKNGASRYRSLGVKVLTRLTGVASNHKLGDGQCGFRAYGRKAITEINLQENGMGASAELVIKAKKQDLTIVEVSAGCKYDNLGRTSTQNPITHAVSVLMSIIRMIVEERPLTMLGVPGLIFLVTGTGFGAWMLKLFVEENRIVTNIALAAMGFVMIGMFMVFTSITLYALARHTERNGH
ncbi:MAG: glycosyltransferase [Candidatus Bathyarchaeota archaeon]|nr:glycosyltransferase [Candidatus Bathyarchaeum tardum]